MPLVFAEIIAIFLGVGVGLSLGVLGGGGSTLAVPILVLVAGMDPRSATTASLLVVGVASIVGMAGHLRHGNVRLGTGLLFGLAGIGGSWVGTGLNRTIDERLLLLGFAALILFVAAKMFRSTQNQCLSDDDRADGAIRKVTVRFAAQLLLAASAVGLLTGLFGVGGGFVVVPALTILLGFSPKEAIGTSLVVISVNAAMALLQRPGEIGLQSPVILMFLLTVTVGVIVGTRLSRRIDANNLMRGFALLLSVLAASTALSALAG